MKQTKEFQSLTQEEIESRINELRKELVKENTHVYSGTAPANPGKLRQAKKNIARLLTILNQKILNQNVLNQKVLDQKEVKKR